MCAKEARLEGAIQSGGRLDRALAEACPPEAALSRERIKALIGEGRVTINGQTVTQPSFKAPDGARFALSLIHI